MAESRGTLPVGVDRLRERIERWRQQRFKHGPMPTELWKSAVEMARAHGIYPAARALSIDYGSLKKRLDAAGDVDRRENRLAVFDVDGRFANFVPLSARGSPHPVAVDHHLGRAYVMDLSGSGSPDDRASGDGLIQLIALGETTGRMEKSLPGRSAFAGTSSEVSWTDVYLLNKDSLLLVKNMLMRPDATGIQAFRYDLTAGKLSPEIDLLPRSMRDNLEARFRRAQAGLHSGTGMIITPILFLSFIDEARLIAVVSQYGGDGRWTEGVLVDLESQVVTELGRIDLPEGAAAYSGHGELLFIGGATAEGPFLRGYRVIVP